MHGAEQAFWIWAALGVFFLILGIFDMCSKAVKPFGFWANAKVFPVSEVKGYNRALGMLFCAYGAAWIFLGLPLLTENSALLIISILGAMFISIAAMAVYVLVIERKYRKKP